MLRLRWTFIPSFVLLGLFLSSVGLADGLVVYSSKNLPFKSGAVIDGTEFLKLQPGQEIFLISPTGQLIKLTGPYEGIPLKKNEGKDKKSVKEAIKNLLSTSGSQVESFGITRSADDVFKLGSKPAPLPSPWIIDATKNGPYCLQEKDKLILWRNEKASTSAIAITIPKNGWNANASWSAGKSKLALPDSMPRLEGIVYRINLDGQAVQGVLNIIPKTVQSKAAQAVWLKEKGCVPQFLTLVRSLLSDG